VASVSPLLSPNFSHQCFVCATWKFFILFLYVWNYDISFVSFWKGLLKCWTVYNSYICVLFWGVLTVCVIRSSILSTYSTSFIISAMQPLSVCFSLFLPQLCERINNLCPHEWLSFSLFVWLIFVLLIDASLEVQNYLRTGAASDTVACILFLLSFLLLLLL
jgi:hypothetical protein